MTSPCLGISQKIKEKNLLPNLATPDVPFGSSAVTFVKNIDFPPLLAPVLNMIHHKNLP